MRPTIRPAVAADVPAIERVVDAAYRPYVVRIGRPPAPMTADYGAAVAAGDTWVLELDGDVAAVLVLREGVDHLLVENLAVTPEQHGRGLGSLLLSHAESQARAAGRAEVRLYTNAKMTENLAYYPRRGFVETGRRVEGDFTRVYFAKRLP